MIGSVYDYYLTTYASKPATKNDTHKKSDLKNIYNNIVTISKKSPLYKIKVSSDMQKYVIDLKENARFLLNDVNNLNFDTSSIHNYKYTSENEDIVSIKNAVNYNNSSEQSLPDDYSIEIHSLATPQINTGNYLRNDSLNFTIGDHAFDVDINNTTYELQFSVNKTDTNMDVLERVSRLINNSDIGIKSNVLHITNNSALELVSNSTGKSTSSTIFAISKSIGEHQNDTLGVLGIDTITGMPSNAKFLLNGEEQSSVSNTFTINKSIELTLNNITKDSSLIHIKKRNNLDSVIDSINELVSGFNNIINISMNERNNSGDAAKLNKEMKITALQHKNGLESVGITINEDGSLKFDDSILSQTTSTESLIETLDNLSSFKNGLQHKLNDITINPMKYVNKTMISYPHPVKAFANPYVTSIYSGMMFNGYI